MKLMRNLQKLLDEGIVRDVFALPKTGEGHVWQGKVRGKCPGFDLFTPAHAHVI
jgi:hypothetical protein